MVYPTGSILTARGVALDPARHTALFNGLTTLEQALQAVDRLSGIGDRAIVNLLARNPDAITPAAGTWLRAPGAAYLWGGGYTNFGASVTLDQVIVNMYAPSSGTYTLRFNTPTGPGCGILKLFRGATQIGVAPAGYDLYTAGIVPVNVVQVAGLVMVAGSNPITFRIDGKNGASAAWDLWLTEIAILRTA
jgi:hypothetical protein